jgi:alpha-1,3-rhamnosyltransferase
MSVAKAPDEDRRAEIVVVVPSYNHAPFVEKCLRSIFSQTLRPKKLLVIDDGSRDDSPKVIERVLKDCPFESELVVHENRGLCRTLNEGLAASSGEYFAYLGSDDLWLPEFLEARAAMLDERPAAVLAYGHANLIDDEGSTFDTTTKYANSWANYPDGDARRMLLKGIAPISSSVMYRRRALNDVSWNEDARLEDYEMYLKLMNVGDFAFDPRVLSAWRRHGRNTSGDNLLMLREVLAAQERNFDSLGVTLDDLKTLQTKTKFLYARIELQNGNKSAAIKLANKNWRGAASTSELAKFYLRMLVPMSVVERRRTRRTPQKTEFAR